jgi:outer membrane protein TolC
LKNCFQPYRWRSRSLVLLQMLDTNATAHADPITFPPDWPNHEAQTEQTICAALAQGWSRAQIVDAAEHANNYNLTGLSVVQAAERADAMIDAARYAHCPTLNAS